MATEPELIRRVRTELGDFAKPFRSTFRGDGSTDYYDLPATNITQLRLSLVTGSIMKDLVLGTDYTYESREGTIDLTNPVANNALLIVEGTSYGLFSDTELADYLHDALSQHTHGATTSDRFRDARGFIRYRTEPVTLATLPEVEELLVVILATVEALWALSTDAATDVDVSSAEGTFVPRSQRYAQLLRQIDVLTEKYQTLCKQLNVGLFRLEMATLRRVSRTTGRLVPLYVEREYDDTSWPPIRITPPIDRRHAEGSADSNSSVPKADLRIYAGDNFWVDLDLPINITGGAVQSAIRGISNVNVLEYFTVAVTSAIEGKVRLSLTPAQTARIGPQGTYDVQFTDSAGSVTTYLRGNIYVDSQVTP